MLWTLSECSFKHRTPAVKINKDQARRASPLRARHLLGRESISEQELFIGKQRSEEEERKLRKEANVWAKPFP